MANKHYKNYRGELITNCPKPAGTCSEFNHFTKEQFKALNRKSNLIDTIATDFEEPVNEDPLAVFEEDETKTKPEMDSAKMKSKNKNLKDKIIGRTYLWGGAAGVTATAATGISSSIGRAILRRVKRN